MSDIRPIKQIGALRANPEARIDNHLRLAKEDCGIRENSCQDSGSQSLADTVNVTGIVFNGTTFEFPAINVEDTEDVKIAIGAILNKYEVDPYISVEYAGGDLIVSHIGEGTLATVITSGTNVTLSRECNAGVECVYSFEFVGALNINGDVASESPWAIGDAGADAEIKADVETLIPNSVATVTVGDTLFRVDVVAPGGIELQVNGEGVAAYNCKEVFTS